MTNEIKAGTAGQAAALSAVSGVSLITFRLSNLTDTTDPTPLLCEYPGQCQPQPAFVELDEDGEVRADYSAEIGNATSARVWHRRSIRWPVSPWAHPLALAQMIESDLKPLLDRVHAGHSVDWDGNNLVGKLNDDAQDASERMGQALGDWSADSDNLVQVWEAGDWLFTACVLQDHWRTQTLDEAVIEILAGAKSDGVALTGDVRKVLLDRAEHDFDADPLKVGSAHIAALLADGRITRAQVEGGAA